LKAFFANLLAGWQIYAAVAGVAFLLGFGGCWKLRDMMADHAKVQALQGQVKAVQHEAVQVAKQDDVSNTDAAAHEVAAAKIQTQGQALAKEIPAHVTPQMDARFAVPVGAVRLLDAAALGVDVSAVPDPAGKPDDAPSGIVFSSAVAGLAANDKACRLDDQQLIDLQTWLNHQVALARADGR
jgi:hypothetical protein